MAALFVAVQQAPNMCQGCFDNVSWKLLMAADGIILMLVGFVSFLLFTGNMLRRFVLVAMIPVVAGTFMEMAIGSDPAYPYLFLALIIPFVALTGLGAAIAAILQKLKSRKPVPEDNIR